MTTSTTLWGRSFVYLQFGGGFEYFLLLALFGEDEPILTSIFFKWVGSTTT